MAWVYLEVDRILRETDKALLVEIDGEEVWLPLSQIEGNGYGYNVGDEGVGMSVTDFIAHEKGLA